MSAPLAALRAAVNPSRVLADLHALRAIGAVDPAQAGAKGGDGRPKGVCRPGLSNLDVEARGWLMHRCAEAGLQPTVDALGTSLCKGSHASGPRLLAGSHSDTQPTGGWLDGALGVVYALEAARVLKDAGLPSAIDVVNFQDEEGRFGTLTGSSVFCGGAVDWDAVSGAPEAIAPRLTLGEAAEERRRALAALGAAVAGPGSEASLLRLDASAYVGFLEAHIEQGRRLERKGFGCAPVSALVGLRQLRVTVTGEQNHAGTTAMADRKDAGAAAIALAHDLELCFGPAAGLAAIGLAEEAVWTIGKFDLEPGAASIIAGKATFVLQFRDPAEGTLDTMAAVVKARAAKAAVERGVQIDVKPDRPPLPATPLDPAMHDHVAAAAEACMPGRWESLHSGALHDAAALAPHLPSTMLFVPSINGISHTYDEDTSEADITAGAEVFAVAAARMLGYVEG